MKSRGVYETPGVTILHAAHRALESITLDREVMHLRDSLGVKFAESVYYGFWFAPEFKLMRQDDRRDSDKRNRRRATETFRGNAIVVGRRSPHSLYDEKVATFEADTVYNQRDAEGFIKLNALRLRLGGGRMINSDDSNRYRRRQDRLGTVATGSCQRLLRSSRLNSCSTGRRCSCRCAL